MNNFCVYGHCFAHDFFILVDGMNMVTTLIVQNHKHQAIVSSQKIYHFVYHSTFLTLSQQVVICYTNCMNMEGIYNRFSNQNKCKLAAMRSIQRTQGCHHIKFFKHFINIDRHVN
jgi:hypothetical protein